MRIKDNLPKKRKRNKGRYLFLIPILFLLLALSALWLLEKRQAPPSPPCIVSVAAALTDTQDIEPQMSLTEDRSVTK